MSEQKVWVEKLPESCSKCFLCYDNRPYWKSTDCILLGKELDEDEIETSVNENCPLQSIHDHDREKDKRIKELEQKVQELQEIDKREHLDYMLSFMMCLKNKTQKMWQAELII